MDSNNIDMGFNGEDSTPVQQNNIIKEVRKLEQQLKDPNINSFRKTIYFNQPNTMGNNMQDKLLTEIVDCLLRIESKLEDIKNFLSTL